ncbi:MAG: PQQ-binding-like beta-propeller repeat protein [Acidobacteriia bacterium]|nr:PQQ-binding-like beta-propeller repeat protein [Terriglobia bacterium]
MTACFLILCAATLACAEDWPRFRGPNGSGVSNSTGLPAEFGPKKNLRWRVEIPMGRSSPVVVKDAVFLTAVDGEKLVTLALDRQTGRTLWRREVIRDHANKIFVGNDASAPTPASDGENVYAFFPDFGLLSFDAAGKERWRVKLGPFDSFYGMSSSPVVHGNTVALVCDQRSGSFAIAFDKDSGKVRWRIERRRATTEAYSTPAVYAPQQGSHQLIVTGAYRVDGYDLETGENLWWIGNQGIYPIGSPVIFGDTVIAVGTGADTPEYPSFDSVLERLDANKDGQLSREEFDKDAMMKDHFGWLDTNNDGIITRAEWDQKRQEDVTEHGVTGNRIGGAGDRTASNLVWRYKKTFSNVITPLIYRDVLYLVKSGGIITALNPKTGEVLKTGRTKDAIDQYFASPVAADGKVFLLSHSGKVTVLKADAQWEVLSVNDLDETAQATPAIADGRIYIRTHKALYSFGAVP